MQFVNVDVDRFGSRDRISLGSFSSGLNAVVGPPGSGKSRLVRWLRSMFAGREYGNSYPADRDEPVSGYVELRNAEKLIRVDSQRRSPNARYDLREHSGRSVDELPFDRLNEHRDGYFDERSLAPAQRQALADILAIPSDTAASGRLEELARRIGLDREMAEYPGSNQVAWLNRQREAVDELRRLDHLSGNRESLLDRKSQLESELDRLRRESACRPMRDNSQQREQIEEQMRLAEAEIRSSEHDVDELSKAIARVKAEHDSLSIGLANSSVDERIPASFRERLAQFDGQLHRWRQTLAELRAYRDRLNHDATDARLDRQIGEQVTTARQPDPRAALRALEAQIIDTRRQLDDIVGQCHRHGAGETGDAPLVLPETLRAMQKNFYQVCQHLSLHESLVTSQSLVEQSAQLQRCESELLCAIEKLIAQRGALLNSIADDYHVSREQIALDFGEGCQCNDHPHLVDWLLAQSPSQTTLKVAPDYQARRVWQQDIQRMEDERRRATARLDELQHHLRQLQNQSLQMVERSGASISQRHESEILCDLDRIANELRELDSRDRLRAELDDLRCQLQRIPSDGRTRSTFRRAVDRHLAALTGDRSFGRKGSEFDFSPREPFRSHWADTWSQNSPADVSGGMPMAAGFAPRDFSVPRSSIAQSIPRSSESPPDAVVETTVRLALAEALAERGHAIPVVLDGTVDALHPDWQATVVSYLARVADRNRQQIVLLTSDRSVEELVASRRGNVLRLHAPRPDVRAAIDINRQLAAYANEHEAEKWNKPETIEPAYVPAERRVERPQTRFFLTQRSPVEQLVSIDSASVARLKAMGVDRVGELLVADARWLADEIRIPGVTESTVGAWQGEANLLCSVPQLRPFDARVLVGAGIRHAQQLAQMHPSRLFQLVEAFLATDRGREILRSGNSYELSRITAWIASAKNGAPQYRRSTVDEFDLPAAFVPRPNRADGNRRQPPFAPTSVDPYAVVDRRPVTAPEGPRLAAQPEVSRQGRRDRGPMNREDRNQRSNRRGNRNGIARDAQAKDSQWRFYLDLNSPIVDAPSIGPRMAARLQQQGIKTVQQLLAANAETLAATLAIKTIGATTIRTWQDQARLVCRIPNLRGHDAQLLVSCGVRAPEDLARMQPETVRQQVLTVARSAEGQRILRGGKQPDLAEVTDWIKWANNSRTIQAA